MATSTGSALLEDNNNTEEDLEDDIIISVLCIGETFSYNVPSFPAFTARVRVMKYEVCGKDGK